MKRVFGAFLAACLLALCLGCSSASPPQGEGGLAPGTYEAEVALAGGSGKASIASPAQLTVTDDGSLMVRVVWSSSNYDLMVVEGERYLPVSTEGGSAFEIPVAALGENLPVQAETTAMSEPHLIDYTLRFDLVGGEPGDGPSGEGASADDASEDGTFDKDASAAQASLPSSDLGNGWAPTGSLPLECATQFAVDYFEDGYKLLRLADGTRYLLVPEGAETPEGLAPDIVVLRQPIGDVYLAASDAMCLFDALESVDAITVSGIAQENWAVPAAVEAMEDGRIVYGGKYRTPDYDLLLAKGCRLAIESTMINHTPAVRDKLEELGIPVLTERSSYEADPLGRTEWVKFYGALLDEEERAAELFDDQARKVRSIEGAGMGKTVAFFYLNSNGAAVVRKPGDYVTRMISLAGGEYAFSDLGDETATSTVTLEMERFYAEAREADVIIYNATIDSGVDTLADLTAKNALLADFKAVREGEVWVTSQNMYQQMMSTGDIIADFNKALNGEDEGLTYLRRLE